MEDLKITIVQCPLHWENTDKNLTSFSQRLEQVQPGSTDVIVLPEMFTTGFTMNAAAVAENMEGEGFRWMQ